MDAILPLAEIIFQIRHMTHPLAWPPHLVVLEGHSSQQQQLQQASLQSPGKPAGFPMASQSHSMLYQPQLFYSRPFIHSIVTFYLLTCLFLSIVEMLTFAAGVVSADACTSTAASTCSPVCAATAGS